MSNRDNDNLEFLLGLSETSLKLWYEQASEDDIVYACELLDSYEYDLFGVTHPEVQTLQ